MLLSFDLTTRRIGADAQPGSNIAAAIKRSRTEALWIKLTDEGALRLLQAGQFLKVTLKEDGKFDSDPHFVQLITSEHYHAGSKSYRALANYITTGLNTLLGAGDGQSSTDKPKASLMGDIQYFESEGAEPICSEVFKATIFNNVAHEEDGTPLAMPTPDDEWVAHGHAQSLTSDQKAQARANIGVGEGSGASPWVQKTTGYSASRGDRILANTSGGGWSLTLPASPALGDEVEALDAFGTFASGNLTILRNGSSIESQADNLTCDVNKARLLLVYVGGSVGWRVVITP